MLYTPSRSEVLSQEHALMGHEETGETMAKISTYFTTRPGTLAPTYGTFFFLEGVPRRNERVNALIPPLLPR